MRESIVLFFGLILLGSEYLAAKEATLHTPHRAGVNTSPQPVVEGRVDRPMRYQPENGGFRISNGEERFNRPLYIGHDGARLDAGDRPEFALYLPGKGGVLRLGLLVDGKAKWLADSESVTTTYTEGRMIYQISDPMLGSDSLKVEAVPAVGVAGGAVFQILREGGEKSVTLLWGFGGVTGVTDFRGDIGYTDIASHYQLRPKDCDKTSLEGDASHFVLTRENVSVSGGFSIPFVFRSADANHWEAPTVLRESDGKEQIVATGEVELEPGQPVYLLLAKGRNLPVSGEDLAQLFQQSVAAKQAVADMVKVRTPNPIVNALVPALNIAADGLWDGQGRFAHGNVAWRRSYFGWLPAYAGDALGWHDRTRQHTRFCVARQKNLPITGEAGMEFKSDGYFYEDYGRIYNWNPAVVDVMIRHLRWTGDLEFAREMWPSLKKHLAREKRLFDRDGLSDAVVAIWASDSLSYNGAGVTHTSAYNFFHNKAAAEIARALGEDSTPFDAESERIDQAIHERLWLEDLGHYAESRDTAGLQNAHPSAALWTVYQTIDSEVPDAFQAWMTAGSIQTNFPQIPVQGPGVPEGDWKITSTSTWMPYVWSINVVAAGEIYLAALASWEAGHRDLAWSLFMGTTIESMFRGICPGNVGMTLGFDAYNGEKIRDFGFIGNLSRTVTEGLFGIRPNLLQGEVTVRPGWPDDWEFAEFKHPSIELAFDRKVLTDRYRIRPSFARPVKVNLVIPARGDKVTAQLNGKPIPVQSEPDAIGTPGVRVELPESSNGGEILLAWSGEPPSVPRDATAWPKPGGSPVPPRAIVAAGEAFAVSTGNATLLELKDPQKALAYVDRWGKGFTATVGQENGHRTVFAQVKQGEWIWWMPVEFEVRPALEIVVDADGREVPRDSSGKLRFRVRNNTSGRIKTTATFSTGDLKQTRAIDVPGGGGLSEEISISPNNALPGSQRISVTAAGRTGQGLVTNWGISADATRFRTVSLEEIFNARVNELFQDGKYYRKDFPAVKLEKFDLVKTQKDLPGITLAIPTSGMGGWIHPDAWKMFQEIGGLNDTGLRTKAASNGGNFRLASGVPFQIPTEMDTPNIALTTQWDAYPQELTLPLSGQAAHAYFLMAGSTYHMQSRFENGEILITYVDGKQEKLLLRNPETWWPVHRDYFVDDFAFKIDAPRPPRVRFDTGEEYFGNTRYAGGTLSRIESHLIAGGAATVLDLPLDPSRELKSLTLRATANEVLIGLMAVTLAK